MESQNMDNLFKEIIESSEDHYSKYSDKAKNYIWYEIQKGRGRHMLVFWKRFAVAATILILLSLSISFYYSKKQSDALVTDLSAQVEHLKSQSLAGKLETSLINKVVTIEKERILKVPVIKTEIVEKVTYVQDTVYVKQLVVEYKEKETENTKPIEDTNPIYKQEETSPSTEVILTSVPKEKKKQPFSLENFLKKRYERNANAQSGFLVLTAKL